MEQKQKPKISKWVIVTVIAIISGITIWLHWESIRQRLMPDYGTDPYTLGKKCN